MITLIEDEVLLAQRLAKKLEREWYNTTVFNSIASFKFIDSDLYLVDLQLEHKAFDLIKEIRSKSDAPIIIFTGHWDTSMILKGIESGADCYMLKSVTPLEFLWRVRALLRVYKRLSKKKIEIY